MVRKVITQKVTLNEVQRERGLWEYWGEAFQAEGTEMHKPKQEYVCHVHGPERRTVWPAWSDEQGEE